MSEEELILWYSNIQDEYLENEENIYFILSQLLDSEQAKVRSFKFREDQRRALLSILLQRALIHETFQFRSKNDFSIRRSVENKPYAVSNSKSIGHWNYNVSHHGDFVCIVGDDKCLIGVDIVDVQTRSNLPMTVKQYVEMFSEQLTQNEMEMIFLEEGGEEAQYNLFYLIWSLKEAFIKAVGQGLGYDLLNVEFSIFPQDQSSISDGEAPSQRRKIDKGVAIARINGILRSDWRFDYCALDARHVVSVARGPLAAALPTFQQLVWKETLPVIDPFQHAIQDLNDFDLNGSTFQKIKTQLVSVETLCEYAALKGRNTPKSKCCQC